MTLFVLYSSYLSFFLFGQGISCQIHRLNFNGQLVNHLVMNYRSFLFFRLSFTQFIHFFFSIYIIIIDLFVRVLFFFFFYRNIMTLMTLFLFPLLHLGKKKVLSFRPTITIDH